MPSLLEGIVQDVALHNVNYLEQNRVYSKIGTTRTLATDPAVVHFGGFQLGNVYKQTVHVRNISTNGARIHILPPSTPYFKASCDNKRGLLVPGLADMIDVEFSPTEYRYYYDCIKIHAEEENLVIPLHAYPIMNETKFPKRLDFGKVAIGDKLTKRVKMQCKVPIEFEFSIRVIKANPCFKVEPLEGIVPAHGHASVSVTFEPLTLSTQELVLEVAVAEFNSQPVRCTVTGSAAAGLTRNKLLQQALTEEEQEQDHAQSKSTADSGSLKVVAAASAFLPSLPLDQLDGTQLMKTAAKALFTNKGGGTVRGGAGGGDAFTSFVQSQRKQAGRQRDCRVDGPIRTSPPPAPGPRPEVTIGSLSVPDNSLTSTAEVTYVLNQEPTKLRIKDVREAIRSKQQEQAAHRAALDGIMAQGLGAGVHPLERPEVPPHIKAALFTQLMKQAEDQTRRVTLGSGVHLGEDILPVEAVAQEQRQREDQHRQHQLAVELAAAQHLDAVLEPAGALHLPSARPVPASGVTISPSVGTLSQGTGLEASEAPAVGAEAAARSSALGLPDGGEQISGATKPDKATDPAGPSPALSGAAFAAVAPSRDHLYQPAWRLIEANDLKKRGDILSHWQRVTWRMIYTRRLRKAMAKIRDVLAQLGWDKQRLAEESANPVLLVSEADRPGTAPTKHLKPDNVRTRQLPLYRDINFTFHGSVPASHYTDFDELGPQQPRTPLEYQVLGYSQEAFPGLTPYAPPLLDQPLMAGAPEELALQGPQPSGGVQSQQIAALPPMPDAMKQAPFTTLDIGNRYTHDHVISLPEPSWGMDSDFLIQPAVYAFHDSTAHEVAASSSVRALRGLSSLSQLWLPRNERWAVQLTDETVPAPLSGPDPADLLRDSVEDADKPAIAITVPSDIASYLPPGMPNVLLQRPITPYRVTLTGGGGPQTPGPTAPDASASKPYELMRQRRQNELDAAKRAARLSSVQELDSRIDGYNSTLRMPCHFALAL
ncbi:hypothetical protein QJQ45_015701 [Haematococcus lacustris]|nr:hypothetical protein QJQ45_015701 [Haematococcus lacustris]